VHARLLGAASLVSIAAGCGGGGAPAGGPGDGGGAAPVVAVPGPAARLDVSRGGTATVSYSCADADDVALVRLVADRDGDLATTADAVTIATDLPETGGLPADVAWDTTGVPLGSYAVLAVATDGVNPPTAATAPGRVELGNSAYAQAATQRAYGIAAAADGSSVAAGIFFGTTTLGAGTSSPATLVAPGGADEQRVFLARFRPDGGVVWARHDGAPRVNALAASPDGSSTVVGQFRYAATFGAGEPDEATIAGGVYDSYVASYRADGSFGWARAVRAEGSEAVVWVSCVARRADGSCLVAGTFHGRARFGAGEANETTLETLGTAPSSSPQFDYDLFVARFEADGRLAWARRAGGAVNDYVAALAALDDGGLVLTGAFRGTATFGAGDPGETVLTSPYVDLFLARYGADGRVAWVAQAGQPELPSGGYDPLSTAYASGQALALDPDGSILLSGQLTGTIVFGLDEPGERTITATDPDYGDSFVARYAANGALEWVRTAVLGGRYAGRLIVRTDDGGYVLGGSLYGDATVGPEAPGAIELEGTTVYDADDVFLARFAPDGRALWARRVGTTGSDDAVGLATFPDGSFGVVGTIHGDVTFGEGEDRETRLTAPPQAGALFLARFNADGGF
jgi:hypothetical protein